MAQTENSVTCLLYTSKGTCKITVTSVYNSKVKGTIKVTVSKKKQNAKITLEKKLSLIHIWNRNAAELLLI